ncbi:MAG: ribosome biogenesis GTPase Der [Candidatus Aminicenantales bacterium]
MAKPAKVVIVGFPNVGKSTLFNRLLGRKRALVHSLPGMTRDQISADSRLGDKTFVLVDTGGFFDARGDALAAQVKQKAWEASLEADVLLFVCDGKRGLIPGEEELGVSLRRLNKPLFIVVNKIDTPSQEDHIGEFFRLGGEDVIPVSAEHKRNLGTLEQRLYEVIPASSRRVEESRPLRLAIVGRINVGKSCLVNRLSGEDRLIVSEVPGTTRDSTDTYLRRNGKDFCLIDTAGIRRLSRTRDKREKAGIIKAKKDIRRAEVVCLLLDATEFPTRQDTAIAHLAHDSGKPLVIALNKWDLVEKSPEAPRIFLEKLYAKLEFVSYAPAVLVSALMGKRVVKILDLAAEVYANGQKKIATSRLNKFLARITAEHPPLSRTRRKIKLKYMVQKGTLPPTFILFARSRASLDGSYEKFFLRSLREEFGLEGNPLRLILRTD